MQYSFYAQEPGNHMQYKTFHVTRNAQEKIFCIYQRLQFYQLIKHINQGTLFLEPMHNNQYFFHMWYFSQ